MCCKRLAKNSGPKKSPKIRHLGTIAQLCRAESSQIRHVSIIGEKLVKQQYVLNISSQYGKLRPTGGWDQLGVCGTPANFNGFRILAALLHASLVVSVSQTLRGQCHLYLAGRPSRWALAHILVLYHLHVQYLPVTVTSTVRICGPHHVTAMETSQNRQPQNCRHVQHHADAGHLRSSLHPLHHATSAITSHSCNQWQFTQISQCGLCSKQFKLHLFTLVHQQHTNCQTTVLHISQMQINALLALSDTGLCQNKQL